MNKYIVDTRWSGRREPARLLLAGWILLALPLWAVSPGETVSLGTASGGPSESQRTFPFPAAAGTLAITYDMYTIPDSLAVSAGGVQLTSTVGRVQGSSTLRVPISGATSALIIVNAGNGLDGTAWTYSVSFTVSPDIPDISGIGGAVAGQSLDLTQPGLNLWGDPVDTGTGAHVIDWTVLRVSGARELSLRAGYNSLFGAFGQLGRGWHHNYEARLSLLPEGGIYYHPHAAELHSYRAIGGGVFSSADLASRATTLVRGSDGRYTLTLADQSRSVFDATGLLVEQSDPQGRAVIITRSAGRISRVTEPVSGLYLAFEYNSEGFVSRVADPSGRSVRFGYDAGLEGKLISLSLPHTGSPSSPPSWTFTYTAQAQLQRATDPDGRIAFVNLYDDKGRVSAQDDGRSETESTQFIYDESSFPGMLTTTVIDRNRSTIRFTYDAEYKLAARMDQNGVQTNFIHDPLTHNLTLTQAPLSRLTRFLYDDRGNLTKLTAADGAVTSFTYDARNNLASLTDALGQTARYTFDAYNRPSQITLPDSSVVGVQSGVGGVIEAYRLPAGGQTTFTYALGRLTRATDPQGAATQYTYDAIGRLSTVTNALGHTVSFGYDANDNITTVTSPLRRIGSRTYSGKRELLTSTNPLGAVMRFAYDGNGNLIEETDALGAKSQLTYDAEDRMIAYTNPAGGRTQRTLDRAGRTTAVTDALGNSVGYTYDTLGNLLKITDGFGQTVAQFTYDLKNRPVTEVDALGQTTTHGYDALDRHTRFTDPLGRVTQYTYDSRSRLTAVTDGLGQTVRQLFDGDNRVVAVADARGGIVDYDYDPVGNVTAITTQENARWRMTYDGAGQLVTATRPSGLMTTLTYDADGRITRIADALGNTDVVYDQAGHITAYRVGIVTQAGYTYDLNGRPLTYREDATTAVGYEWDVAGRLSQITYPSGHAVRYAYDAAGHMISVTDWAQRVTRYTWDKNGRLTRTERANGTSQTRAYNAKGQLTQLRELGPGGASMAEWTLALDAAGQVTTVTASPEAPAWLPTAVVIHVDGDNRVASYNGQSVQVDADGNLWRGPLPSGAVGDYLFNERNRLVSAGGLTYGYDLQGRRTTVTQSGATTRLVYDPTADRPRVLVATTGAGSTEYVYGIGLILEESAGRLRYYHHDYRGSTVAVTDETGTVKGRAYYGSWGENAGTTGDMAVRFLFHGEWGVQTDANGLLYMGARYYHPLLRRFISPDPVQFRGGVNWYTFAGNNPISQIDPLGLWEAPGHTSLTNLTISQTGGFSTRDVELILAGNLRVDRWTNHIGDTPNAEHNMPGHEQLAREGIAYKLKRAIQLEIAGKHDEAMGVLGEGLHSAQDINHAMSSDPSLWQHFWGTKLGWGYDPDDPGTNSGAWGVAEIDSVEYMRIFQIHLESARQGNPIRVGWKGVFK